MRGSDSERQGLSPALLLAFGVALVPYALLVWRFNFVYDDAYISFRYARNLADGLGLRFNLGVQPPVEGYTNFLWTLWIAVFEWLGLSPVIWSLISSFTCALVLLWVLLRFAQREFELSPAEMMATGLFFGTLPPLAVWATGGLETMPFALAVFLAYERLASAQREWRWLPAGLAAAAAALLRADGPVFVGIVLGVVLVGAALKRERPLLYAALRAGAFAALVTALHVAFRLAYYHAPLPNTAATKVGFSGILLGQGRDYVMEVLLAVPSIALVLLIALALVPVTKGRAGTGPLLVVFGMLAYAISAGGDFMTFGRFIVPALPFVCVLAACQLAFLRGRTGGGAAVAIVWVAVMAGLSLPAAFDAHAVPESIRARYRLVRFNPENNTQYKLWLVQKRNTEEKVILGKALARHTEPGESFVRAAIGAVGYYSGLFIYDRLGLVSREVGTREVTLEELQAHPRPPGHQKAVEKAFFREQQPTYVNADLAAEKGDSKDDCRRARGYRVRCEFYPLEPDLATDEYRFLVLTRAIYD